MTCFAREGFHQTSMTDIYTESGLSAGAVYHYFGGKGEIIEAIAVEAQRIALEVADASSDDSLVGGGLADLAEPIFSGFEHFDLARVDQRTRLAVQFWAEAVSNPRVRAIQVETVGMVRTAFAQGARRRQAAGELDPTLDADALARAMIALFHGLILQRTWDRDVDLSAYRAVVRAFLDGVRSSGPVDAGYGGGLS